MKNIKISYIMVQIINMIFFLLSYMFIKDYFNIDQLENAKRFLILLPFILSGAYVFYTNRIFYILIKDK